MAGPGPLDAREAAVLEANAVALGVPLSDLIERAGRAVAEAAQRLLPPPPAPVAVLVGPGQNGGDGSEAAVHLAAWGYAVTLYPVPPSPARRPEAAERSFRRASAVAAVARDPPTAERLAEAALVVDALLGVGHRAPLRPEFRSTCRAAAEAGVPVLAVDLPTGFDDPDGIRARNTVTFTGPKAGVPPERTGTVSVVDIGIPPAAWEETGPGDFLRFPGPERMPRAGRAGRVVVIGGGPYAGAPALAALAALRAGAERATVIVPESIASVVQGFGPDLVVRTAGRSHLSEEFVPEVLAILRAGPVEAVVAGPGAGRAPGTVAAFRALLRAADPALPWVVDADALPALAPGPDRADLAGRALVATPNAGEFARALAAERETAPRAVPEAARWLAGRWGATVIVKGAVDTIAEAGRDARNRRHGASMAVAGAGDVLDGVVAALLAAGVDPWGSARLATFWAGETARRLETVRGPGLRSPDLVDALPETAVRAFEGLAAWRRPERPSDR